ncbi:hypothetical protein Tco_0430956 [Tanacetum coccineum]
MIEDFSGMMQARLYRKIGSEIVKYDEGFIHTLNTSPPLHKNSLQPSEARIQLLAEEFDLIAVASDIDETKEVNANCILMANLQQAPTSVIMEYLVKISKKARILELKRKHLKIIVLTSYTPYPSRKIQRICSYTSQKTMME